MKLDLSLSELKFILDSIDEYVEERQGRRATERVQAEEQRLEKFRRRISAALQAEFDIQADVNAEFIGRGL